MSRAERPATISLRVSRSTKERLTAASAAHPYRPSITAIIERGIDLALAELAASTASLSTPQTEGPAA